MRMWIGRWECSGRVALDELKMNDFRYQVDTFCWTFGAKWALFGWTDRLTGDVFYLGGGSIAPLKRTGRPWVPKGDFEASWEAPLGASWLQNVKKLMRILTISVKMSLSPTRELNFEAWGSPRWPRRGPLNLKELLWRPRRSTWEALRRLQELFGANLTPSRIHSK